MGRSSLSSPDTYCDRDSLRAALKAWLVAIETAVDCNSGPLSEASVSVGFNSIHYTSCLW